MRSDPRFQPVPAQIERYLEWKHNPCGKPPLILSQIKREERWNPSEPCLSVSCFGRPNYITRRAMLTNLQGAFHNKIKFPATIGSYYEGFHPDAPDQWVIVIYGIGKPARKLREPWNPLT